VILIYFAPFLSTYRLLSRAHPTNALYLHLHRMISYRKSSCLNYWFPSISFLFLKATCSASDLILILRVREARSWKVPEPCTHNKTGCQRRRAKYFADHQDAGDLASSWPCKSAAIRRFHWKYIHAWYSLRSTRPQTTPLSIVKTRWAPYVLVGDERFELCSQFCRDGLLL
jgi:hypothetical protein